MCEFLHVTPKQLGKLRDEDPRGVNFLEHHIIWEAEERHKAHQESERRAKRKH